MTWFTTLKTRYAKVRERRWVRWGMDLLLVGVVLIGVGAYQTRGHVRDLPLPALTLERLDGVPLALDALSGKPTLLAFWAPWCGVCRTESSNLSWAQKLVGDRANVISVAVSYDDLSQVRAYVAEQEVDYPVLLGGDSLAARLKVSAYPTVYFLDAQGRVKSSAVGYTTTLGLLVRLFL